jgi:iron(III) transport system substrate-binding protein
MHAFESTNFIKLTEKKSSKNTMKITYIKYIASLLIFFNFNAIAETNPLSTVMLYQGSDREKILINEAKKEGIVNLYTSQNPKDSTSIIEAFQKKYGIKVLMWRASGEKVIQRAVAEARANRNTPDVFESDGVVLEALAREKLLQEFYSPHFKYLPTNAFTKDRPYVADRFNFFTIAYNTNLVKSDEVPNSYLDLLEPKWAGKLGLEVEDIDWFAAMVKDMGEKNGLNYFQRLKELKPQMRKGHSLMAELVAAGEIPIAVSLYNHAVERLALSGAPIRWKSLSPTFARIGAICISAAPPHPHAALLFTDFVLSKEGQELLKSRQRVPASTLVSSNLNNFNYKMIDPSNSLDESKKWEKIWNDLFINKSGK